MAFISDFGIEIERADVPAQSDNNGNKHESQKATRERERERESAVLSVFVDSSGCLLIFHCFVFTIVFCFFSLPFLFSRTS